MRYFTVIQRTAAPALARLEFSRTGWLLIGTWLLFQAVWTIPAVVQRQVYPVYIAGDLAAGLLPILLFAIGWANPQLFGRAMVLGMTVALLIAVVLAALVSGDAARFEAPASMLTAFVWYRVATVRGSQRVFGWLLIAVVILVVAFGSGQRTSLVIWAGGACYALVVGLVSLRIVPVLLSLAADQRSDLLVMGCYGHGRAREWALGGVTRTMLSSMTLPVLMAH